MDDDVYDDADNDSWGDSDDGDLFGLPGHNCKKSEGVGYYYVDTSLRKMDDDVYDDTDNDSWGDSDDGDLFDLPGQNCKK